MGSRSNDSRKSSETCKLTAWMRDRGACGSARSRWTKVGDFAGSKRRGLLTTVPRILARTHLPRQDKHVPGSRVASSGLTMADVTPNRVLARNLDRLLSFEGTWPKEAAEAIGVPYKWLRRAVSQGLARPDRRNAARLHARRRLSNMTRKLYEPKIALDFPTWAMNARPVSLTTARSSYPNLTD